MHSLDEIKHGFQSAKQIFGKCICGFDFVKAVNPPLFNIGHGFCQCQVNIGSIFGQYCNPFVSKVICGSLLDCFTHPSLPGV